MTKKYVHLFILGIFGLLIYSHPVFADDFIAKIDRLGMESSYGTPYLEVVFTDLTSGTMSSYYYAVPVDNNAAFPYIFSILSYAKTRNKLVRVLASDVWTRGDGYNSFLEIHYAQFAE